MKRSTYAVLWALTLVLVLATVSLASAAPQAPADQPAAEAPVMRTAQDGTLAAPVSDSEVGSQAGTLLCLDGMAGGPVISPSLPSIARPQVGSPCCESLCDQVCGVGEACFCKRCQVLGCGV